MTCSGCQCCCVCPLTCGAEDSLSLQPRPEGAVHPKTSPGERGLTCGIVAGLSRSFRSLAAVVTADRNFIHSDRLLFR